MHTVHADIVQSHSLQPTKHHHTVQRWLRILPPFGSTWLAWTPQIFVQWIRYFGGAKNVKYLV